MKGEKGAKTPAAAGNVLTKNTEGETRKEHRSYRSVIGTLNFLVNRTHPEMKFAVHQCARFCNNPKYSHEQAVKRMIKYLISTTQGYRNQGIIFTPDKRKSMDADEDASFAENGTPSGAMSHRQSCQEPETLFPTLTFRSYCALNYKQRKHYPRPKANILRYLNH